MSNRHVVWLLCSRAPRGLPADKGRYRLGLRFTISIGVHHSVNGAQRFYGFQSSCLFPVSLSVWALRDEGRIPCRGYLGRHGNGLDMHHHTHAWTVCGNSRTKSALQTASGVKFRSAMEVVGRGNTVEGDGQRTRKPTANCFFFWLLRISLHLNFQALILSAILSSRPSLHRTFSPYAAHSVGLYITSSSSSSPAPFGSRALMHE